MMHIKKNVWSSNSLKSHIPKGNQCFSPVWLDLGSGDWLGKHQNKINKPVGSSNKTETETDTEIESETILKMQIMQMGRSKIETEFTCPAKSYFFLAQSQRGAPRGSGRWGRGRGLTCRRWGVARSVQTLPKQHFCLYILYYLEADKIWSLIGFVMWSRFEVMRVLN